MAEGLTPRQLLKQVRKLAKQAIREDELDAERKALEQIVQLLMKDQFDTLHELMKEYGPTFEEADVYVAVGKVFEYNGGRIE